MNSLALLQTVQTFWRDNGKSVAKDEKEFVFYGEIINLKPDEMKMSRYQMTAEKIDRKSFDEKTYVGYTYENIFGNNENIPKTGDFYLVKWHSPGVIDRGFEFVLNEKASNVILMRRYLSPD